MFAFFCFLTGATDRTKKKKTTLTSHLCEQPVDNERITIAANRDKIKEKAKEAGEKLKGGQRIR